MNNLESARQQAQRFAPKVEILPPAQRRLWDELKHTPKHFVLYEGTALALRLAHRTSEDFDFFSNHSFAPDSLRNTIPYLHDAEMTQFETNTLTAIVDRIGPVKVSFFGGLALNRIQDPDGTHNGIQVASLLDIDATKLATIQQRAQGRDYEDIAAIIVAGISLSDALAAAATVYGKQFNGALSLKALTYFADGDLPQLSPGTQEHLRTLAGQVNLKQIPVLQARTGVNGGRHSKMNTADLQLVARRVVWFKKSEDALQDTKLFLAHLMTYGTLSDITTTLHYFSESDFEAVLEDPPPGIFDRRSWTYWNVRYRREPVPALPKRNFALFESSGTADHR